METNREVLADGLRGLSRLPEDIDPATEAEHIEALITGELSGFLTDYVEPIVIGAGGSGIVLRATYAPFGTRRAIKLPRRRQYTSDRPEDQPPEVDPEMHALSKISHKNITRLYDFEALSQGRGFCYITEYVDSPRPLHTYAESLCADDRCRQSDHILGTQLRRLASIVHEIVDAIRYMHDVAKLLHFDLKPDNILVSDSGRPFVTDLGFARDLTRYAPEDMVRVGFTWKYAHPSLTDPYRGGRVTQSPAKSKNEIPATQLQPVIDLFAFGRTLQEVLKSAERDYGASIYSLYAFNYLHIVACLCLDGRNAPNGRTGTDRCFVSDQALGMPVSLFGEHRFLSFAGVATALERLLGLRRIEDEVPELNSWSGTNINVSDLGITTFTPRIKSVLEHPTVKRLSDELQLGMLETIYPTATHTRLHHSLGVYHAVTQYLIALYYDPDNPTFRILLTEDYAKRAMVAALVHDLGQSTFGHEMEELDNDLFSHVKIGEAILTTDNTRDRQDRQLRAIIEGNEHDCWGVQVDDVVNLLRGETSSPFEAVLCDILDGQLDADKMDFLARDSVECRVPYAHGVDISRFLRMLTTTAREETGRPRLRLAVKRKGSASAEGFALARYQMYQAVYWHHTFRAIKAMLMTVASAVRGRFDAGDPFRDRAILHAYVNFVIGVAANTTSRAATGDTARKIRELLAKREQPASVGTHSSDRTLTFFYRLADGKDRRLVEDLCTRNYYKRLFEVPLGALAEDSWMGLRDNFLGPQRLEFQNHVNSVLVNLLRTAIQDASQARESLRRDRTLEEMEEIAGSSHCFLVDLPTRGWTAGGDAPLFVSDYKRRYFRADAGGAEGFEMSSLWSRHLSGMMREIAFFRVFCEPRLHRILTRVLSANEIDNAMVEAVPGLRRRV